MGQFYGNIVLKIISENWKAKCDTYANQLRNYRKPLKYVGRLETRRMNRQIIISPTSADCPSK